MVLISITNQELVDNYFKQHSHLQGFSNEILLKVAEIYKDEWCNEEYNIHIDTLCSEVIDVFEKEELCDNLSIYSDLSPDEIITEIRDVQSLYYNGLYDKDTNLFIVFRYI